MEKEEYYRLFQEQAGSINDDGILDAALTPRLIQPTTFAEISGNKSERTKQFSEILRHAHILPEKRICIYGSFVILLWWYRLRMGIMNQTIRGESRKRMENHEENSRKAEKEILIFAKTKG